MLYKIVQYNAVHHINGIIEYNYNIIKITTTYDKALEYATQLKRRSKKLYKIERV